MSFVAAYRRVFETGELKSRIETLHRILKSCTLCPRRCRIDRLSDERGYCGAGRDLTVSSVFPHFGEEPPLVGHHGSGTIFLTHCNLRCVFCQNYEISHLGGGECVTSDQMARYILRLQEIGCHNINFVTPTHYVSQIVAALPRAIEWGLRVPLVYNCGGYESLEVIRLLDGVVDIYMPDVKFFSSDGADRFCNAPDYPAVVKSVLKEMHNQVGDLETDAAGIAQRGLLIRHLVLPQGLADTEAVMRFIVQEVSPRSYVNVMAQYRPVYEADAFPDLNRRITTREFKDALDITRKCGIYRGFG